MPQNIYSSWYVIKGFGGRLKGLFGKLKKKIIGGAKKVAKNIRGAFSRYSKRCKGRDTGCCTEKKPCDVGDGNCNNNNQCRGSLVCGKHNCGGAPFGKTDNCCMKEGTVLVLCSLHFFTAILLICLPDMKTTHGLLKMMVSLWFTIVLSLSVLLFKKNANATERKIPLIFAPPD